ncbi:MAG: GIY-YIG nuclease family protein [archaeon]|nr:GIY-YIG nuclease family protein [archaeon]MCR4323807.1 GIY-YIG nuclease family protein [Nanoarchaeota archaeon]
MCQNKGDGILMQKPWFVYILECQDGTFYTGVTTNLERRMESHSNGKGSKYVYNKGFKQILKSKPCQNRSEAQKEEARIKKLPKNQKLDYFD